MDNPVINRPCSTQWAGADKPARSSPASAQLKGGPNLPCNYKLYPANWLTEIRPLILRRAGEFLEKSIEAKCESCGVPNHSMRRTVLENVDHDTRIVLTVAHLDQDIENNDPENLAALCQRCHLLWDRPWHLITASLTRDRRKKQPLLPTIDPEEWRQHVKTKQLTHSFNVLLDDEHMTMLNHMASKTSTNMSIVIRQAIKWRFIFEIDNVPTCSNGRSCFVPHMHAQPATQPQGANP